MQVQAGSGSYINSHPHMMIMCRGVWFPPWFPLEGFLVSPAEVHATSVKEPDEKMMNTIIEGLSKRIFQFNIRPEDERDEIKRSPREGSPPTLGGSPSRGGLRAESPSRGGLRADRAGAALPHGRSCRDGIVPQAAVGSALTPSSRGGDQPHLVRNSCSCV